MPKKPDFQFTDFVSPKAKCLWPHVHEPGKPYKKNAAPEYSIDLVLNPDNPQHKDLIDGLRAAYDSGKAHMREHEGATWRDERALFKDELDRDKRPTGRLLFKAKQPAWKIVQQDGEPVKKTFSVDVFDSAKKDTTVAFWSGSVVRALFTTYPYAVDGTYGLAARLKAVQVIQPAGGAMDNASAFDTEDGYVEEPYSETASAFDDDEQAGGDQYIDNGDDELPF